MSKSQRATVILYTAQRPLRAHPAICHNALGHMRSFMSLVSTTLIIIRYSGYDPRAVGKRECKNSSIFCHPSPQCGKIMIPRYLMDLTLPFPILYPEFVYLLWL